MCVDPGDGGDCNMASSENLSVGNSDYGMVSPSTETEGTLDCNASPQNHI